MCLPLSLLLLLPVPGLLLVAAVRGLSAHGPLGVAAAVALLWSLVRVTAYGIRAFRSWWSGVVVPEPDEGSR